MKPRRVVWIACILFGLPVMAAGQTPARQQAPTGSISGSVLADDNGAPVAAATIAVRRAAGAAPVGGRIADREGRFTVTGLPAGTYIVEIRAVGRAPMIRSEVVVGTTAVNLGELRLAAAAVQLQGVTGQAQRPPVQLGPDRSIYTVRDMPVSQVAMITEALRTIPELEVDFEDAIRARGGTPAIHIDGRPAQMQGEALTNFLRSLRADRVDRIEYIPNPSAAFDAEGQSGIVNIVLRRDVNLGLSGTLSGNGGTQGTRGSSLRLNYQNGRLTVFGGGAANFSDATTTTTDLRQNLTTTPITFLEQTTFSGREGRSGSTDVVAEWKVTPRSTLWTSARANWSVNERTGINGFVRMDAQQNPTERSEQLVDGYGTNRSWGGSIGFRRVIQPLRDEFSTELRYGVNWAHSSGDFDRYFLALDSDDRLDLPSNIINNDGYHDDDVLSYQADLSRPMGATGKFDLGYRLNLRDNQDEQFFYDYRTASTTPTRSQHDLFEHLEDFHAAYLTLERRFGTLTAQAGMRAELADTRVDIPTASDEFENDYIQLYPSLNLAKDFGNGKNARLSYSRRVQRPTSGVLNPINLSPNDLFNQTFGNPRLDPMYIHSVSLDASWAGTLGTLRISPYAYRLLAIWDRLRTVDENGVSTLRYENVGEVVYGGSSVSASLRGWGPLSGSIGFNMLHGRLDAGNRTNVTLKTATIFSTNTNASVRLSPTANAQVSISYTPGQPLPQGRQEGMVYSTLAVRQQLMQNKLSVNLAVLDPFDVYRMRFTTSDAAHQQTGRTNPSQRRATLTLSYNFGRTPQSTRRTVTDEAAPAVPTGGDIR